MNDSTLIVFQAINAGQPVPKQDLDAAIKTLEEMLPVARDKGPQGYADRIQDSIERARQYKKVKGIKPRSFEEIQKDIDSAHRLVSDYRMHRKYESAARWERNRDEYDMEYKEAAMGRPYIPKVEEADENVAKNFVPEGFQLCL